MRNMTEQVPVLTIDGPSGAGKGTIAKQLAEQLGWHILDSGALYRLTAYAAERAAIGFENEAKVAEVAKKLNVRFSSDSIFLDDEDVSLVIRTETAGNNASRVAAMPAVRAALLDWQRQYAKAPGLVADGRDMGTTVFPQAAVKVFLTANAEERAHRRYKQLKEKGITANLAHLVAEINERDARDRRRSNSPLVPADDALHIDSTHMSIAAVVETVLQAVRKALV
jgi:cytidylate kinase